MKKHYLLTLSLLFLLSLNSTVYASGIPEAPKFDPIDISSLQAGPFTNLPKDLFGKIFLLKYSFEKPLGHELTVHMPDGTAVQKNTLTLYRKIGQDAAAVCKLFAIRFAEFRKLWLSDPATFAAYLELLRTSNLHPQFRPCRVFLNQPNPARVKHIPNDGGFSEEHLPHLLQVFPCAKDLRVNFGPDGPAIPDQNFVPVKAQNFSKFPDLKHLSFSSACVSIPDFALLCNHPFNSLYFGASAIERELAVEEFQLNQEAQHFQPWNFSTFTFSSDEASEAMRKPKRFIQTQGLTSDEISLLAESGVKLKKVKIPLSQPCEFEGAQALLKHLPGNICVSLGHWGVDNIETVLPLLAEPYFTIQPRNIVIHLGGSYGSEDLPGLVIGCLQTLQSLPLVISDGENEAGNEHFLPKCSKFTLVFNESYNSRFDDENINTLKIAVVNLMEARPDFAGIKSIGKSIRMDRSILEDN